jgi:uncharacterized protein
MKTKTTPGCLTGRTLLLYLFILLSATARSQDFSQPAIPDLEMELLMAVHEQNLLKVKELLATGVSANAKDYSGTRALMYAINGGNEQIVWLLIAEGADVNATDRYERNALMHAIIEEKHKWVNEFIPMIKNLNHRDVYGYTALTFAAQSTRLESVEDLIYAGADLNLFSRVGTTPMMHAAAFGNFATVDFLLEYGADPNRQAIEGSSALHLVAWYGHNELAGLLLDWGANIELADSVGNTPLMVAIQGNQPDMVWYLIESGASVAAVNKDGFDALYLAAALGRNEIVEFLLGYDFILQAQRKRRNTLLGHAYQIRNHELVESLRSKGFQPWGLYFSEIWLNQGIDFNRRDVMYYAGAGVFEARFGLLLTLGYLHRIGYRKLLGVQEEGFFYQFHEKRNAWSIGISKEQELYAFNNGAKAGVLGGVDMIFSTASYRGTGIAPPEGMGVSPSLALYVHKRNLTWLAAWNFFETGQPLIPPHRYRISVSWRLPLYKRGNPNYQPVLN